MNGKFAAYADLSDYLTGKPMVSANKKHAKTGLTRLENMSHPLEERIKDSQSLKKFCP